MNDYNLIFRTLDIDTNIKNQSNVYTFSREGKENLRSDILNTNPKRENPIPMGMNFNILLPLEISRASDIQCKIPIK